MVLVGTNELYSTCSRVSTMPHANRRKYPQFLLPNKPPFISLTAIALASSNCCYLKRNMPSTTTRSRIDSNDDDTHHDDDCMSNVSNNGTSETLNGIAASSTAGKQPPPKRRRTSPDEDDDDDDVDMGCEPAARPLMDVAPVADAVHQESSNDGESAHNKASALKFAKILYFGRKKDTSPRYTMVVLRARVAKKFESRKKAAAVKGLPCGIKSESRTEITRVSKPKTFNRTQRNGTIKLREKRPRTTRASPMGGNKRQTVKTV